MPWPPEQRKAIAARMRRQGKSPEEIAEFFRKHGHGGGRGGSALAKAHRKSKGK